MRANGDVAGEGRRWRPLLRCLLYGLLLLVCCGAAAAVAGLIVGAAMGGATFSVEQLGTLTAARAVSLIYAAVAAAALLATWWMTALVERRPLRTVGFGWDGRAAGDVLLGLLLGVALQTGIVLVATGLGWARRGPGAAPAGAVLLWGLLLFVPAALFEELTMRGYLLPTLREAWGKWAALGVTSLLFGALHSMNPGASPFAFAGTTAAGVMLGLAYLWTGRLWLPWALHVGWNWAQGSLWGLSVSGVPVPSLFRTELRGPTLWTGGDFGPEAGLLGFLAVGVGTGLLALRRPRGSDGMSGTGS